MESRYFNNILHYISEDERFNQEMPRGREEFQKIAGSIMEGDR